MEIIIEEKSEKVQDKGVIEKISDHVVNIFFPSVLGIWYIFLFMQIIIILIEGNYEAYLNYGQIALTLFGFTLLVTFINHISKDKKSIKQLISINLGFLLSSIGFLIVYATASIFSFMGDSSQIANYIIVIVFYIFSIVGLFGLTFSTINLYLFLRKLYKSLISEGE